MTRGTGGFSVCGELILMNVVVTRLAFQGKPHILNARDAVHRLLFVAIGTLGGFVFPDERKAGLAVVERRHFPFNRRMTLGTAVLDHLIFELSLVKILVARFTAEIGKVEDKFFSSGILVTTRARNGDMSTGQREPCLLVLLEGERRWFESPHRMAGGAVVGVPLFEFSPMVVFVAVCALLERQLKTG